jgi:beta-1,4-N-acetylglucosaminyltransferase
MRAFVTVGATSPFDSLIEILLQDDALTILKKKGYDKLVIQAGPSGRFKDTVEKRNGVSIEIWQLKSSLQSDFEQSDLIISHAGM